MNNTNNINSPSDINDFFNLQYAKILEAQKKLNLKTVEDVTGIVSEANKQTEEKVSKSLQEKFEAVKNNVLNGIKSSAEEYVDKSVDNKLNSSVRKDLETFKKQLSDEVVDAFKTFQDDLRLSGLNLTVKDRDGKPNVDQVNTIKFTNGSVTNKGGGQVEVDTTTGGPAGS